MVFQAIIVEPNPEHRAMVREVVSNLGHDIEDVTGPAFCQAYAAKGEHCPAAQPCCDLQILNNSLDSTLSALEFLDWQKRCGCKIGAGRSALLADGWTEAEMRQAAKLGARTFVKPFMVKDLVDWLYHLNKVRAAHEKCGIEAASSD